MSDVQRSAFSVKSAVVPSDVQLTQASREENDRIRLEMRGSNRVVLEVVGTAVRTGGWRALIATAERGRDTFVFRRCC